MRFISAAIWLALYLAFLAWYDGWGTTRLTQADIDTLADRGAAADATLLEAFQNLAADDDGNEFYMLNLNRYAYAKGEAQTGSPADYQDYGQAVLPLLLSRASHPIYSGEIPGFLLAGEIQSGYWHDVILVRYRSRRDFFNMVTSPEYQAIVGQRAGGIEYAEVTPTRPGLVLTTPRLLVFLLLAIVAFLADRLLSRRS